MSDTPTPETPGNEAEDNGKESIVKRLLGKVTPLAKKPKLVATVVIVLVAFWLVGGYLGIFDKPESRGPVQVKHAKTPESPQGHVPKAVKEPTVATPADVHRETAQGPADAHAPSAIPTQAMPMSADEKVMASAEPATKTEEPATVPAGKHETEAPAPSTIPAGKHEPPPPHGAPADHGVAAVKPAEPKVKGVVFVDSVIAPMDHELNTRFWGWRVNDILNFTDNVNNFQLGVLEVTRRTSMQLAERISRTGSTEAFDRNLENAMNWFMIRPKRYWFPSPESKYQDGLDELRKYRDRLEKGQARFHARADNLIPLLIAFEDLLGSCDENLVKHYEEDGSHVSFFKADDYFYYSKGVASAMHTILQGVAVDFQETLTARGGMGVLEHAIESCHHAMEINPLVITNSSLSGILANHRANMAAPISHARFYVGVLIKTLST